MRCALTFAIDPQLRPSNTSVGVLVSFGIDHVSSIAPVAVGAARCRSADDLAAAGRVLTAVTDRANEIRDSRS